MEIRGGQASVQVHRGEGPVAATALHSSHRLFPESVPLVALDEATRAREEDPYTDVLARDCPSWILPAWSRFQVDLNRPPEEALYLTPRLAWGLQVWKEPLPKELVRRSLAAYDEFYAVLYGLLDAIVEEAGGFVLLDLHAYNHRRAGPFEPPADPRLNPEVNIGTGSMDRERWAPVVEGFMEDLRRFECCGHRLDVRENVNFRGRELARRVHRDYAGRGCVLAVEFKKFFMDEWTGILDLEQFEQLRRLLKHTLPGLVESLRLALDGGR